MQECAVVVAAAVSADSAVAAGQQWSCVSRQTMERMPSGTAVQPTSQLLSWRSSHPVAGVTLRHLPVSSVCSTAGTGAGHWAASLSCAGVAAAYVRQRRRRYQHGNRMHVAAAARRALQGQQNLLGQDVKSLEDFTCTDEVCEITNEMYEPRRAKGEVLEDPSGEFVSVERSEVLRFVGARAADFAYDAVELSADTGDIEMITVRRGDLLESTQLRPRDLRAVVLPPLPGSDAGPVLACRGNATMLLGIGTVRAIVQPSRALLFGPDTRERSRFLRVLAGQRRNDPATGFVMSLAESALLALERKLDARLLEIRSVAEPILRKAPVLREPNLEEVRQQRRLLLRCSNQATAVYNALLARLDGGEAASLAAADGSSSVEWEAMLEVYLQAYGELSRECVELLSDIEDFEGSANLALQARRLRLEQFELSLVIASVSIGAGSFIPGVMGMNLLNKFETAEGAFFVAVGSAVSIGTMLFLVLRTVAVQQGFFR